MGKAGNFFITKSLSCRIRQKKTKT